MAKPIKNTLLLYCLVFLLPLAAYGQDSTKVTSELERFLEHNPQTVLINSDDKGILLNVCANDDFLLTRMSVGDPLLFMRMITQGVTIYIDPTGTKKHKYAISFPAASDTGTSERSSLSPTQPSMTTNAQERPDIIPLINELNSMGAKYSIKGKAQPSERFCSLIELNTENEEMYFYILIPKSDMMEEKKLSERWSVGVYVAGQAARPSDNSRGLERGNPMMPRPPFGNEKQMPPSEANEKLMRKEINLWAHFLIDEVSSINIDTE